ncbi:MAG: hypothetical protein AABX37_03045, partial [Nanoarchaeota archaeon]
MDENHSLVVFQDKKIRRLWHNGQWYFSVVDVIRALAVSSDPKNYWKVLKRRNFAKFQMGGIWDEANHSPSR